MIFWICFWLIYFPISLIFPTKVIGRKNLPKRKKQNVIVSCNHMSNLDAPILDLRFKQKFVYLSKKELFKNKFMGFMFRQFGCIPVDRSKPDLGAVKKAFKALKDGKNLGIFPQGTRTKEGDIDVETVKEGVTLFSLRTGTPVLPMAIVKKPKRFRKNLILVGELIFPDMQRNKDKQYAEEFTKIIVDNMNDLLHKGEQMLCKKK